MTTTAVSGASQVYNGEASGRREWYRPITYASLAAAAADQANQIIGADVYVINTPPTTDDGCYRLTAKTANPADYTLILRGSDVSASPTSYSQTITGTTSDPTKGAGFTEKAFYGRQGPYMLLDLFYMHTVAGADGSGIYLYTIPGGLSADTTIVNASDLSAAGNMPSVVGNGLINIFGVASRDINVILYSATQFAFRIPSSNVSTDTAFQTSGYFQFGQTNLSFSVQCRIPISGW